MRRYDKVWEKIFAKDTPDKLVIKKKKSQEFLKLNVKKTNSMIKKNWPKTLINTSPKKTYTWENSMKRCPTYISSEKMQVKTICHYVSIGVVQIQGIMTTPNAS